MKYVSRPVVIDAFRNTEDSDNAPQWVLDAVCDGRIRSCGTDVPVWICKTNHGFAEFGTGDWLIRGRDGEIYPCKDEIFKSKYEVYQP